MFFVKSPEKIKEVLATFSKRQRIGLRQEYGSRPIDGICFDPNDGYCVVHFGPAQHSFWIRETGKIVHRTIRQRMK